MASSKEGNAYSASIRNTRTRSTEPPTNPDTRPSGTPIRAENTTDRTTTSTAVRAPQTTRDQMS